MNCERWKTGCGECPHLDTYPAMRHDQTAANWKRKQEIYSKSRLSIVAPSDWLLSIAKQSILAPAIVQSKVIPNGIDLNTFNPKDKSLARNKLGLPLDAIILLFVSAGAGLSKDSFKDYSTIQKSIKIVAQKHQKQKLVFIALGKKAAFQKIEDVEIRYLPYEKNPDEVASYYNAADIYLHASKAETFGLVIVEAQACGTPVIATATGGIPEIILDGQTGLLTEPENPEDMAEKIFKLLNDKELRESISSAAMKNVKEKYSLDTMVHNYLEFYEQVIDESGK
jgi:glycosyltransferase involved in cell wall biosynthesis